MVPPERIELSSPAPEAGTLSTELQGHSVTNDSTRPCPQQPPGARDDCKVPFCHPERSEGSLR